MNNYRNLFLYYRIHFTWSHSLFFHLCSCTTSMPHGAGGTPAVGFVEAKNVISRVSQSVRSLSTAISMGDFVLGSNRVVRL